MKPLKLTMQPLGHMPVQKQLISGSLKTGQCLSFLVKQDLERQPFLTVSVMRFTARQAVRIEMALICEASLRMMSY